MIRQEASTGQFVDDGKSQAGSSSSSDITTVHIKVYSPFRTYYEGMAQSISAVSATGPFDILPRHHKFMTLLEPCELVIATDHGERKVKISGGLMHVKEDNISVLLDI